MQITVGTGIRGSGRSRNNEKEIILYIVREHAPRDIRCLITGNHPLMNDVAQTVITSYGWARWQSASSQGPRPVPRIPSPGAAGFTRSICSGFVLSYYVTAAAAVAADIHTIFLTQNRQPEH